MDPAALKETNRRMLSEINETAHDHYRYIEARFLEHQKQATLIFFEDLIMAREEQLRTLASRLVDIAWPCFPPTVHSKGFDYCTAVILRGMNGTNNVSFTACQALQWLRPILQAFCCSQAVREFETTFMSHWTELGYIEMSGELMPSLYDYHRLMQRYAKMRAHLTEEEHYHRKNIFSVKKL